MSELRLTRNQLAEFLPNQRAVLAFEKILKSTTSTIPTDLDTIYRLITEGSTESASATAKANVVAAELSRVADLLERISLAPPTKHPSQLGVDYIDFAKVAPHTDSVARLDWNQTDDTLNIHHSNGVIQQVGEETYARCYNATGSLIANGSCVGYFGVSAGNAIEIQKYISDGTMPSYYLLGVMTEDIADSAMGRVTIWGHVRSIDTTGTSYGETWAAGDILYAHPTTAGGLTKVKPTAPSLCIPLAIVVVANATTGDLFVRPVIQMQQYFGSFSKTADASPAAINTAYPITFDTTRIADGVSIDGTVLSKVVVANSGLYSFSASFQLTSTSASTKNVWLWFRKGGVDIPNTAVKTSLDSATAVKTIARTMCFSLAAGNYVELMWAADDTAVTLDAMAATAFGPAAPSCILEVLQVQQ